MNHSLLPPRGVFVPTQLIFNTQLPAAVLVTWIQLRCLAWKGWVTPPFTIPELASLISIHPARLNRHLSQLQEISALACRSTEDGKLVLSFPVEPNVKIENTASAPVLSASSHLTSQVRESPESLSYFPARIMGYLSFQDDQDGFNDPIEIKDIILERQKAERCV
jgi:hypothetical protein